MSINKDIENIENNLLKKRITILINEIKLSYSKINKLSKDIVTLKLQNFNKEKINKELQDNLNKMTEENKELQDNLNKMTEENKLLEIQISNLNNKNIELTERLIKMSRFVINYGG
jgi:predicted nuclease with TOPRIM domain